ncbi:hypothetical protein TPA0910_87030 [Streptomyces hygroscopicus subsp. sporocinereus]|uniref:Uncharacterized protein n=1 Tax=Streptomyces hygroscopicus TaxID=1912 RepID=A0ABQ3UF95_STRHY|nr:hypothetical protein [Streptomyces hygroscopicus]GHJ34270.1 hypothetical protein TPA0910_87030 [Streptomyces hygroscopicus]
MTEKQYQAVIRSLEDEAQRLRGLVARLAAWINNPANDPTTCRALAEHVGLPAPRQETQPHGQ